MVHLVINHVAGHGGCFIGDFQRIRHNRNQILTSCVRTDRQRRNHHQFFAGKVTVQMLIMCDRIERKHFKIACNSERAAGIPHAVLIGTLRVRQTVLADFLLRLCTCAGARTGAGRTCGCSRLRAGIIDRVLFTVFRIQIAVSGTVKIDRDGVRLRHTHHQLAPCLCDVNLLLLLLLRLRCKEGSLVNLIVIADVLGNDRAVNRNITLKVRFRCKDAADKAAAATLGHLAVIHLIL